MRKEFSDVHQMKNWLKGAAEVAIVSAGILSDVGQLQTNMTSPTSLAAAIEQQQTMLPTIDSQLPCFVDYESASDNKDTASLNYEEFMSAFCIKVQFTGSHHQHHGGTDALLREIGDTEYMVRAFPSGNGYSTAVVLVRMPQSPHEVVNLREAMRQRSFMVVVPDGSGQMHFGNVHFGRPFRPA